MLGAIAGDVIGSAHERNPIKTTEFPLFRAACRFTDDTVLTVATAAAILNGEPYGSCYREYGRRYPTAGYGASFYNWMLSDYAGPYNSWGNGAGMRVSPIGFAFSSMQTMLREATRSAEATHNHREGVKGAQAIAFAILKARKGATKEQIRQSIMRRFGYDLTRTLDSIRPNYFSTCRARARCRKPSWRSSSRKTSSTRFASRCRSGATATRSRR